jgi:hypothetical protein
MFLATSIEPNTLPEAVQRTLDALRQQNIWSEEITEALWTEQEVSNTPALEWWTRRCWEAEAANTTDAEAAQKAAEALLLLSQQEVHEGQRLVELQTQVRSTLEAKVGLEEDVWNELLLESCIDLQTSGLRGELQQWSHYLTEAAQAVEEGAEAQCLSNVSADSNADSIQAWVRDTDSPTTNTPSAGNIASAIAESTE